jgi:hypothetical protein
MVEFRDNDGAFLAWLAVHTDGYVINIGRSGRGHGRLHRAGCRTINSRPPLTRPYIKICSASLSELDQWAARQTDTTVTRCGTCHPPPVGPALADATGRAAGTSSGTDKPFAVFLTLGCPRGKTVAASPELVKALIDGTVAAFQGPGVTDNRARIAARVAAATGEPAGLVAEFLADGTRGVLGAAASLVHLRGEGVQWNPADHRCTAGQLLITQAGGDTWTLSGTIHAVEPSR